MSKRSCATSVDCPSRQICHPVKKVCVKRGDAKDVKIGDLQYNPPPKKKNVNKEKSSQNATPQSWGVEQGTVGFNIAALAKINGANLDKKMTCTRDGTRSYHQNVAKFLFAPHTPVHRLLLAHQLGTGKTLSMISMLDNFYDDPRPIIFVVPRQSLVINFYSELMTFPSKFRDYVISRLGEPIYTNDNLDPKYRKECVALLEKKGKLRAGVITGDDSKAPRAPLKAFRLTQAGGSAMKNQAILKISRRLSGNKDAITDANMFENCILAIDEAHLMVRPETDPSLTTAQVKVVHKLGQRVKKSTRGTCAILATATPIVDRASDSDSIMDIVYGVSPDRKSNEGYISWFMNRPNDVFAKTNPSANELPTIVDVPLTGENLEKYLKESKSNKSSLQTYENATIYQFSEKAIASVRPRLATEGYNVSSKLDALVKNVKASGLKTAILMDRKNGLKLLQAMFEEQGVKSALMFGTVATPVAQRDREALVNEDIRTAFNAKSNIRGADIQVLILDSRDFSEGVSLLNVRHIILADMSPGFAEGKTTPSWGRMKQRVGRALRFCSHSDLPQSERQLKISLYISSAPGLTTIDQKKLAIIKKQHVVVEMAMCDLELLSIDSTIYGASECEKIKNSYM